MKNLKSISLGIAMFISVLTFGQEKNDTIKKSTFRIVCAPSLSKQDNALVIIDGHLSNESVIKKLDTSKIESITIIKEKAATALYGIRGKNGAIYIKTKNLNRKEKKYINK